VAQVLSSPFRTETPSTVAHPSKEGGLQAKQQSKHAFYL